MFIWSQQPMNSKIKEIRKSYWAYRHEFFWNLKLHGFKILIIFPLNFLVLLVKKINFKLDRFFFDSLKRLVHALPVLDILIPKNYGVKRYLRSGLSFNILFKELHRRNIRYVVINEVESVKLQNTLFKTLLVHDDDLDKISDLFSWIQSPNICAIYSVFGSRCSWSGLPYYNPVVAEQVIKNSVLNDDYSRCPHEDDQYYFALYHAVIHLGDRSDLILSKIGLNDNSALTSKSYYNQGRQRGIPTLNKPIKDFYDAFKILETANWLPSLDTLRKVAKFNPWVAEIIDIETSRSPKQWKGELLVFIIRDWAIQNNYWERILKWFRQYDYVMDVVEARLLAPEERLRATKHIRGGVWSQGPFPVTGGYPAGIIVLYNFHPNSQDVNLESHPFVKNSLYLLKSKIRDKVNLGEFHFNQSNFIHSSDDEIEALDYLKTILPADQNNQLLSQVERYVSLYEAEPYEVLETLSSLQARAKVEVINFKGIKAVKKTYKPGRYIFLEREILAYEVLSKSCHFIPPLLEKGEDYLIIPYYTNQLANLSDADIFNFLREKGFGSRILEFMYYLYEKGYALIDFRLANLLITENNELKILDYEFLYKYSTLPRSFVDSFNVKGTNSSFNGDVPRGYKHPGYNYYKYWKKAFRGHEESLKRYDLTA
jgi:hypothetical protein